MPLVAMADAVAGQIALSAEYNKLIDNIEYLYARLPMTLTAAMTASTQTVTTSVTALGGAGRTVNAPEANTRLTIRGYFDVEALSGLDIFVGTCSVDGTPLTGEVHWAVAGRGTVSFEWVTVVAQGAHTINLRVQKVNNNANMVVNGSNHSKLVVVGNGIT